MKPGFVPDVRSPVKVLVKGDPKVFNFRGNGQNLPIKVDWGESEFLVYCREYNSTYVSSTHLASLRFQRTMSL